MKVVALFSLGTRELLFVVPKQKWQTIQSAFYVGFDQAKLFEQEFESLTYLQDFLKVPTAAVYEDGKFTGLIDLDEVPYNNLQSVDQPPFIRLEDTGKRYMIADHKVWGASDYWSFVYVVPFDSEQALAEELGDELDPNNEN